MGVLGYLVPEFPSQTHAFFWREVQALRALGTQVRLLSTVRPAAGSCRHDFASAAAAETGYLFPAGWLGIRKLLLRPLRALRAVRYVLGLEETPWSRRLRLLGLIPSAGRMVGLAEQHRIEHVHIHSCANSAHLGALGLILGGPSYSLTLHGDLPVYGTDHKPKMRNASFVACVTRPLREQVMRETGLPAARVPVLWMGVDTERFRDRGLRNSEAGVLRAITVARLNWPKGHRFALQALKRLKDAGVRFEYQIVGEGPYRQGIVDESERLGLARETRFLGSASEEDVAKLLANADVLLLPSVGLGEAAPVAVMEAMASGMPVVASIIGGTADMIEDGVDGFLCAQEDVDAITDRLQRLAFDLSLRQRIGSAARLRAERDFDAGMLAGRLTGLIAASRRG